MRSALHRLSNDNIRKVRASSDFLFSSLHFMKGKVSEMPNKTFNLEAFTIAYQLMKRRCMGSKVLLRKRTKGMLFYVEKQLETDRDNVDLLKAKKLLQS